MIGLQTEVTVAGLTAKQVYDFMLHCTDEQYRRWWPGTHLAFHTVKRNPDDLGNLVVFDEKVGKRRLRFEAVVVKLSSNREIVWQMKKAVKFPAWLVLKLEDSASGVRITHLLQAGYNGFPGRLTDQLLRLYLNERFARDLKEHACTEFNRLAVLLRPD